MSLRASYLRSLALLLTTAFLGGGLASAQAAEGEARSADAWVYETSDGQQYFAAGLAPYGVEQSNEEIDLVVLFDTSASQIGIYREDALEALQTMLVELGDSANVRLVAVDLQPVEMTNGFVPANSDAMDAAFAKLEGREPLGATDLTGALEAAADMFAGDNPRAVIYIGDGYSQGNFVVSSEYTNAIDSLTQARASVSSFAIGMQRDIQLLAAVANQTGGTILVDANDLTGQQAGMNLASTAKDTVVWPTSADHSVGVSELLPSGLLPLRAHRDAIVLGTLEGDGPHTISFTGMIGDREVEMSWVVTPQDTPEEKTFIADLVRQARADDGASLPTVGREGLREAERVLLENSEGLARLGAQALASGDAAGAQRLAQVALQQDANNPQAAAIERAAVRAEAPLLMAQADGPARRSSERLDLFLEEGGQLLDSETQASRRRAEIIIAEVEVGLQNARDHMRENPEGIRQNLKILLEGVQRAPDLTAEVRSQLSERIVVAIRESEQSQQAMDVRRQQALENDAVARAQNLVLDGLTRDEERVAQLLARYNSLLDERQYGAAEEAAVIAEEILPDNPIPNQALEFARLASQDYRIRQLVAAKQRGFLDNLYNVETSAIPFPDEPPIVYPEGDWWLEMSERRAKYASIDLAKPGSAEQDIFDALDETTDVSFFDDSLLDVVLFLEDYHGIQIEIDAAALAVNGLSPDEPITRELSGISLRSALRLMLNELDLTYTVRDEVLMITTPEEVENDLITKVYPVADLVLPIPQGGGLNPFALGGGGGQGGGLGGQQGGFGGQQGGFGGQQGGGFGQQFAVEEDSLTLVGDAEESPQAESPQAAPTTPAREEPALVRSGSGVTYADPIEITAAEGQSLDAAWDAYFQANATPTPGELRATARRFVQAEDFANVTALIRSALRSGIAEPWMYEGLALALQAQGAPQEELERALMSAVDVSTNVEEVLYLARYMSSIGLDQRALAIYRDVADSYPTEADPYLYGLEIATRLNDLDALQWSTLGVLRQAWTVEQQSIEDRAYRTAAATLAELRQQGRNQEAIEFERQVNEALARDVVVRVEWTGDADIDVLVLEPTGSVCSFQNDRTTAGGVLLGDSYTRTDESTTDGYSEAYVCPEAFAGDYRVMLRRVWGRPTAGKVTVEVYQNYRTPLQQVCRKQISLEDGDTYINFELADGRRHESLADHQIEQAVRGHVEVSRAVLAQQLSSVTDSQAVRDLAVARRRAADAGLPDLFNLNNRGVGFQPEITTLPSGVNMSATAVISADRRYVRITAYPLFSTATAGDTFNFATGMAGTDEPADDVVADDDDDVVADDDDDDDDDDAGGVIGGGRPGRVPGF